jgi:peptidyl-prolyl cis-trans isomerase C
MGVSLVPRQIAPEVRSSTLFAIDVCMVPIDKQEEPLMSNPLLVRAACLLLVLTCVIVQSLAPASAETAPVDESQFWEAIKDSPMDRSFEIYLEFFPYGAHAALAREKLVGSKKAAVAAAIAAHSNIVEVRARHILVRTEAEAKEIIKQLQGGADFATLAKSRSLDTATGKQGGELYWFDRNVTIKEFSDAAFALKPGQFSQVPVRTDFGYHVIQVEEVRTLPPQ